VGRDGTGAVASELDPLLKRTESLAIFLFFFVILAVGAFVVRYPLAPETGRFIGVAGTLFLAAAALGAFFGFLFAVPRVARDTAQAVAAASTSDRQSIERQRRRLATNTNLEEVSDWFTKMVIGIGLVQLREIEPAYSRFGAAFDAAFPSIQGAGLFLCCLGTAALLISFLFFYVETRTLGTVMFDLVEKIADGLESVTRKSNATPQFEVSPLTPEGASTYGGSVKRGAPIPADEAILAVGFDKLQSSDQFAAWAAAKARLGELVSAAAGWSEAIKRDIKGRPSLRLSLAEVFAAQNRPRDALAALKEAIATAPPDSKQQLALKAQALLAALYIDPPQSFIQAQHLYQDLLAHPEYAKDPWVRLWAACALGQKARWLRQTRGADTDVSDARAQLLEQIEALKLLAPDRNAPARVTLRNLIDPTTEGADSTEDDLVTFRNDKKVFDAVMD
jgi:tetratricopeptide (TPR) repeat protein